MKRVFAIFLTCVFLLGLLPTSALAAEPDTGGLCPHHQEHSYEVCGYIEAVEGHPCAHVHDGSCGYVEAVSEVPCDMGCSEIGGDGQIIHAGDCAYSPAVAGQPCGYVCRICPVQAMIDALPNAEGITLDNRADVEAQLAAIDEARAELTDEEIAALDVTRYAAAVSALAALDGQAGADVPVPAATKSNVSYLDADGTTKSTTATEVTNSDTTWSNGWYFASGNVTIGTEESPQRVTVSNTVNLILEDGCNLTISSGIQVSSGNTLNIYAQSTNDSMGALTATDSGYGAGIGGGQNGAGGTITINGGSVTAEGEDGAGIGGGSRGDGGTITINGGTVNAKGTNGGAGIGGGQYGAGGSIIIQGSAVVVANGTGSGDELGNVGYKGNGIGNGRNGSGTPTIVIKDNATVTANGANNNGRESDAIYGNITVGGNAVVNARGFTYRDAGTQRALGGTLSSEADSTAKIFSNGFNNNVLSENFTSGLIFTNDTTVSLDGTITENNGASCLVYGNQTLNLNMTIASGGKLTITENSSLTIPRGVTVTDNGTITNNGTLTNNGTINGDGSYLGTGTVNKANQTAPGIGEGYAINCTTEQITIENGYCVSSDKSDTIADGPIDPGKPLYVRKEESNFYNASDWTDFTTPSRGVTPSVSIDYENETLNTTTAMQYASGHSVQSWESCSEDMAVNAFGWDGSEVTAQFRTAATADKYASEAQEVTIPARPATPSGLQGQNTSFAGESDGTITGLTAGTAYQISKDGGSLEDKTATGEGTITDLAAGDYQVRLKATATAFASATASVTVGSGDERTYTLTVENIAFENAAYGDAQPAAKNITISSSGNSDATISSVTVSDTSSFTIGGSGSTVMAGGSIDTWTVQPNDGLSAGEHTATITVTYNNNATAEATVRFHVTGAAQAAPANAPELDSKSYNSVTLKTVSANANGAAAQYSKGNGQTWQDSPIFTGLSPSTKYTFVVRYEATGNYEASPASPVLEVTTEAAPVATYLVTVNGGTGGGSYAAGATVTITATVPNGQRFTGWTVNPASVTLANASSATTTFTMPAGNVTVTANFQSNSGGGNYDGGGTYTPPTTPTYPPTVERPSGGGGTPSTSPSNPKQGDTVTVTPKPDSGYEVDTITVIDRNGKPVEVTKKLDGTYTFKQPNGKVKIEVSYKAVEKPWNNPFSDVSEGDWYYEAVRFVQENGLMNGYSDGRFGANDTLSRAQLAQILFNKEGRPAVSGGGFNDVDSGAWYADAVTWAAENGIVGGYGNGTFGPNDPITREQLAVMLWRYSGSPAATDKELHFNDTDEISGFALDAMRWAVENGILNGYGDGRLGPQGQATRAQVAQMLKNFFEKG